MIECYECNNPAHKLSSRSRCVDCEHRRAIFNEKENEKLREQLAQAQAELARTIKTIRVNCLDGVRESDRRLLDYATRLEEK